jgi:plastocyanin
MPHDVTGGSIGPASDIMMTGDTYSYTFVTAGSYPYICSIHPSMTGTVTVTP